MQAAKIDALGYRLEEMKDMPNQRELRMEVQMAELNNQMHTLSAASCTMAPADKQPQAGQCLCALPISRSH